MPLHGIPPETVLRARGGRLGVPLVQSAKGTGGLDADADRGRGQVRQRYLFDLDDLYSGGVRARRDRVLYGLVRGLGEGSLPALGAGGEDAVDLTAHGRDRGADRVRRVEVLRPDDLADARQVVRGEDAAAADRDQGAVALC